ncbi:type III secretion protein [Brucella endophytica]|uniref:Type III secretion protein n=1 Tax=Brucella endophytica TaxID=1963359 RepID=A0A916WK53_9HYPH|nr:FliM/FliN family flagellar motor switch protein [Brucella endophytica]GGB05676.1 type III secretion protein [Brucella endophytica]
MLRDTGVHFGAGCGGASIVTALARQPDIQLSLPERLARPWAPIACTLAERPVLLSAGDALSNKDAIAVPVRIGPQSCKLILSSALIAWLQQRLGLEGALTDEEPPQRALLLELASLDLLQVVEKHLGEDIRFGDGVEADSHFPLDLAVVVDGTPLALRLELTPALAEAWVDFIDHIQPPQPVGLSGLFAELVIEAGSQDLSIDELASLRPGDIVMLASQRPIALVDDKLVAPVRRQSDGFELGGAFAPKARRALAGSEQILRVVFEFARTTMTLAQLDELKPGQHLPLSCTEETGVDIVVDDRRIGRGELAMIGMGLGVRIVHLLPNALPVWNSQTS